MEFTKTSVFETHLNVRKGNIMKIILALLIPLMLFGCATAHKMGYVNLGMTKPQVIEVLGRPSSVSAQGSTEVLRYNLYETDNDAFDERDSEYFVRLMNGNVESYGRMGDFDSTKD